MGGYLKVDAQRVETTALNTKIHKKLLKILKYFVNN